MDITDLSAAQLRRAADLKEQLAKLQKELAGILGVPTAPRPAAAAPKKKGKISAAGIARIKAAQKARWAKIKGKAKSAEPPHKQKFTMSAAAKAAISKAAKARWAKIKAAKKQ
jgi:hypothetical protein